MAKKTIHRSAEDGKFITKKEAENKPKTTVKENVKVTKPKK
jgi:hypothetical protein